MSKEVSCFNTENKLKDLQLNLGMVTISLSSEGMSTVSDNHNLQQQQLSPVVVKSLKEEEESHVGVLLKAKLDENKDRKISKEYLKVKKTRNEHKDSQDPKALPTKVSEGVQETDVQGQIQLQLKGSKLTKIPDYSPVCVENLKTSKLNQVPYDYGKQKYMHHKKYNITGKHLVTVKEINNQKEHQVQTKPVYGARPKDNTNQPKKKEMKTKSHQFEVEEGLDEWMKEMKKTKSHQLQVEEGEGLDEWMKQTKNQELAGIEDFSVKQNLVSDLVMNKTRHKRQSRYRVYQPKTIRKYKHYFFDLGYLCTCNEHQLKKDFTSTQTRNVSISLLNTLK